MAHHRMIEMRRRLTLTDAWIDPLTGTLSGAPEYAPDNEATEDWDFDLPADDPAYWRCDAVDGEERHTLLHHTETCAWTAQRTAGKGLTIGQGFSLFFELAPLAGGASNDTLSIEFGDLWKLVLTESSEAELLRRPTNADPYETQTFFPSPVETIFEANRLLIFECGDWLTIRNWNDLDSEERGFKWLDKDPEVDANGKHALRAAQYTVAATGRAYLGHRALTWKSPWSATLTDPLLFVQVCRNNLQDDTSYYEAEETANTTVTVTVYDENGYEWDEDPPGNRDIYGFYYTVDGSSTETTETARVGTVHVDIEKVLSNSGTVAVNLAAVTHLTGVEWARSLDPRGNTLTATVRNASDFSSYIEPDMALELRDGATKLYTGLLESPQRTILAKPTGGGDYVEELTMPSSASRRLDGSTIFQIPPQDGELLENALAAAIEAAAIDPANITVPAIGYVIPTADPAEEPVALPGPGDSPGQFLDWLIDTFAADYAWKPLPEFKYEVYLRDENAGSPQVTFYTSSLAAKAAGVPAQTVRSLRQTYSPEGYANMVFVVGQRKDKELVLAADINWTDLFTRPPYLPVVLLIIDEAIQTQELANWICRQAYIRVSAKRVAASMEAPFVTGAEPGVTIEINPASGDNYRILSCVTRYGPDLEAVGLTTYEMEKYV